MRGLSLKEEENEGCGVLGRGGSDGGERKRKEEVEMDMAAFVQ